MKCTSVDDINKKLIQQKYIFYTNPFSLGDMKTNAVKLLEETAEAFSAYENYKNSLKIDESQTDEELKKQKSEAIKNREALIYECCDTIQAACNLMYSVRATSHEVNQTCQKVFDSNYKKGRYDFITKE